MPEQGSVACWSRFLFVRANERSDGEIRLSAPEATADGRFTATVVFEGVDLEPVGGAGETELAAVKDALRRGSAALEAYRASGGVVLQPVGMTFADSQLRPLESLEEWAESVLVERFGDSERAVVGEVVEGPVPTASGDVAFTVAVNGARVTVFLNQNGMGPQCDDRDDGNAAMRVVNRFLNDHDAHEQLDWFRESARLRREAGNPPDVAPVTSTRIRIAGEPNVRPGCTVFRTVGAPVDVLVLVYGNGGVMDDCEDWTAITQDDRSEAIGVVLHHLMTDPARAASLGLDPQLLAEFYT